MSKKKRRQNRPRPTQQKHQHQQNRQNNTPTTPPQPPEPEKINQTLPTEPRPGQAEQVQSLVKMIVDGHLDDYLGVLQTAIEQRRRDHYRAVTHQAATELHIGDRVRLNHEIRPQYLHGATGTITGWAHTNAIVELDNPTGRFTQGQLRCPPLGLQRLSE